jgi:long-chain acyl-CoA synthetase
MESLSALLAEQVELHGSRPAIRHRPRYRTHRWSYADLGAHVRTIHAALAVRGVKPGDRVLLCSENSPYWVAAFFAVVARGAVVVPVNPRSPPDHLNRLMAAADPSLVLRSARWSWPGRPVPAVTLETAAAGAADGGPALASGADALAEIIYTSGTTGDPKGVMLSHHNLLFDLEAVLKAVPLQPCHHVLSLTPLFHVYGQMTSMLCPLRSGCTVTYLAAPTSRALREALTYTPATHLVAIPEALRIMMERLESELGRIPAVLRRLFRNRIRARISRTLQTIICGGAPLDPVLEDKFWSLGFEVLQGYGLTETSPVISANTSAAHRTGSVGRPLQGVEVKIAPDGEILVRGPTVMQGYFRDVRRTRAVFAEDWFRTDDAGRFDADGFLYVFGRKQYMILGPGGENVFPEDLEAELNRQPGVRDSAVVGLIRDGRTVIHAVLLCDPAQGDEIVARANRVLAPHQQIMRWSVWPEADFPRSVTRKVKKEDVIRRLAERQAPPAIVTGRLTPLKRLLAEVTRSDPASLGDSTRILSDLEVDSLRRIELVTRIEEQFGVYIEELQITPRLTVAELETLVKEEAGATPRLGRYPRWSLAPWASRVRPWVQRAFFESWILYCCRLQVEGLGQLADLRGPVMFMANHRSFLDAAVAVFAIPARFRARLAIAAATEVLYRKYPWAVPLGELGLNSFPFPTEAHENIRPGLDYVGRLLDDDWSLLIFPEGKMNRSDQPLLGLKGGTGVLAVEMAVPVVPLVIEGTETILPPDKLLPRSRGVVTVRFGLPLRFGAQDSYSEVTARIEQRLRSLLRGRTLERGLP